MCEREGKGERLCLSGPVAKEGALNDTPPPLLFCGVPSALENTVYKKFKKNIS